jgi:hypothetical protein
MVAAGTNRGQGPDSVPTKVVRYRHYIFDTYTPANGWDRWRVVIWPPNNSPPITMPGHASGEEATKEAQAAVDHILDGGPPPKL